MTDLDTRGMVAQIEANVERIREQLDVWARHMAARYNGPVYLTGSTLHNPSPRDVDLRVVMLDEEFAARYGNEQTLKVDEKHHYCQRRGLAGATIIDWHAQGPTQRWIDDVAKFGARLSVVLGTNVDLQIWPESYWRDCWPPPIELASPSPHWWIDNKYAPVTRADTAPPVQAGATA